MRNLVLAIVLLPAAATAQEPPVPAPDLKEAERKLLEWSFGPSIRSLKDVTDRADAAATQTLDEMHRLAPLSASQRAKLQLAARGDIKHFLAHFDRLCGEVASGQLGVRDVGRPQWMRTRLGKDLFGPSSLLQKSARANLDEEQLKKLEPFFRTSSQRERQLRIFYVRFLFSQHLSLKSDDSTRLQAFLAERIDRPPLRPIDHQPDGGRFRQALKNITLEEWQTIVPRDEWDKLPAFLVRLPYLCEEE
jgi:hypothetical protein